MNRDNYFSRLESKLAKVKRLVIKKDTSFEQAIKGLIEDYIGPIYGNLLTDLNSYRVIK